MEALGCSTPEARLMLAEGTAAVHKRRRGRQYRQLDHEEYDPKNHLKYLDPAYQAPEPSEHEPATTRHTRSTSDMTDHSASTVTRAAPLSPATPLGNYSANLAMFIKARLQTIPTYTPSLDAMSPRSCPDFSFQFGSPPQSRRPSDAPSAINIPPVRPPLQSSFSAWSSTDDEGDECDEYDQDLPPLPENGMPKASSAPRSIVGFYAQANNSFLFTSTPAEEYEEPATAKGFQFFELPAGSQSPPHKDDADYYPSSYSSQAQLSSSSGPSFSFSSASASASASSYFDIKRPMSFAPHLKDRIIAAVTPPKGRVMTAVSPFDGDSLSNVHDVFVESQQRVHVDGLSFDMLRDFNVPSRVTTPC
jgi:hypothetical protein